MKRELIMILTATVLTLSACQTQQTTETAEPIKSTEATETTETTEAPEAKHATETTETTETQEPQETTDSPITTPEEISPETTAQPQEKPAMGNEDGEAVSTKEAVSERMNIRIPVPDTAYFMAPEQLVTLNLVHEFYVMLDGEDTLFPAIYAAFDTSEDSKLELEEYMAESMAHLSEQGFQAEDCGTVTLGNGVQYRKVTASTGTFYQEFYTTPAEYEGEETYAYIAVACNDAETEKKQVEEVLAGMIAY